MKIFLLVSGILLVLGAFDREKPGYNFLKGKPNFRNYYLDRRGDDANRMPGQ